MKTQIYHVAVLAYVDAKLDDLKEEFGDIPDKITQAKDKLTKAKAVFKETEGMVKEVKDFMKTSKQTIKEYKDKETKLSKQQFLVRNNKEFDAITKEIDHMRKENTRLTDEMRAAVLKEENLGKFLEEQKKDVQEKQQEVKELQEEFEEISGEQNDEMKMLIKFRDKILKSITPFHYKEYETIRVQHKDAAVRIKKNSCTGCYNSIPHQKVVESRNNLEQLYYCEQCGRIIFPEDFHLDDSVLK